MSPQHVNRLHEKNFFESNPDTCLIRALDCALTDTDIPESLYERLNRHRTGAEKLGVPWTRLILQEVYGLNPSNLENPLWGKNFALTRAELTNPDKTEFNQWLQQVRDKELIILAYEPGNAQHMHGALVPGRNNGWLLLGEGSMTSTDFLEIPRKIASDEALWNYYADVFNDPTVEAVYVFTILPPESAIRS